MPTNYEADYQRVVREIPRGRFLPHSRVEIIREARRGAPPRHVLFDFDGTLSLIREGWPEVMVPMMVQILAETGTKETPEQLYDLAYAFVMELNGKQTVYQMIRLAEEVAKRGGKPLEPLVYKEMYHGRLMERISHRRDALRTGAVRPEEMLVPHTLEILDELARRGVGLYLASGTDEEYVREEARLLTLDKRFGVHIYGAIDDYRNYSKAMVIERILRENKVEGEALLGFGDGYVEIENVKAAGGIAVAVATKEAERDGQVNEWKRERLVGVGADIVMPDFADYKALISYIWDEPHQS